MPNAGAPTCWPADAPTAITLALTDDKGMHARVNRPMNDMFGYDPGELIGRPVETLVPVGLQASHRSHRAAYAQASTARPMGTGMRLVGLRKDGATFPVEIRLNLVPKTTGQFTLAVIRDLTTARQRGDLIDLARAAAARARGSQQLLNSVSNFLNVGLSLQAAIDQSDGAAAQHITEALSRLDPRRRRCRTDQRAGVMAAAEVPCADTGRRRSLPAGPREREPPSLPAARASQGRHDG